MGEGKADEAYRKAFAKWEELAPSVPKSNATKPGVSPMPAPETLDDQIATILRQEGGSLAINHLNARMRSAYGVRISDRPERTWRAYLQARPGHYRCEPRGPDAKVCLT